jgi:hypothetical protein
MRNGTFLISAAAHWSIRNFSVRPITALPLVREEAAADAKWVNEDDRARLPIANKAWCGRKMRVALGFNA